MLGASTYESFRVSTLDVKSRVRELATLVSDVIRDRVPIVSLDPCLEELSLELEANDVTHTSLASEATLLRSEWSAAGRSEKNIKLLQSFLFSVHDKLEVAYKGELEAAILAAAQEPNARDKCRRLVNSYCAMLINDGYSREYILNEVETRFFSQDIKKVEKRTLQRFFSKFNDVHHRFTVYIPVSKDLASYLERLEIRIATIAALGDLPDDAATAIKDHTDFSPSHQYLEVKTRDLDAYSALRRATEFLSSMVAMTYVGRRGVDFEWYPQGYVKLQRAKAGSLISNDQVAFRSRSSTLTRKVISQLKTQADHIMGEFTDESTERLLSAINISALSRSSPRPENQLITLWSAIEVLLSDPPKDTPRVVHYVDTLTPCICIKYVRRYIIAVFNELRLYHAKHIRMFFRKPEFDSTIDQYTNFTKLLYMAELKELHREFTAPMKDNPLALYRLWKLEKNFGDRVELRKSLAAHEQRVRWQLFRIYRTRNNIVHSGSIPTFLLPLVMNVYEYFQDSTGPILGRASAKDDESAIDQIVAEIGFDYKMMLSDLQKNDKRKQFTEVELLRFHR
jgi:hypothetical protein